MKNPVAPTPTTVHLHGESGSGKELVARTLHTFACHHLKLRCFNGNHLMFSGITDQSCG